MGETKQERIAKVRAHMEADIERGNALLESIPTVWYTMPIEDLDDIIDELRKLHLRIAFDRHQLELFADEQE